jgi:transcription antitermination factor NusG
VRVLSGVFEGVEGIVTEFRHQCRVVIALSAVKQCFSLEVELGDIDVLHKTVSWAGFMGDRSIEAMRA